MLKINSKDEALPRLYDRFSLENLIYLTIILLPVYLIKLTIFDVPTNLLEILIGIIFIWWLIKIYLVETQNLAFLRKATVCNKKYIFPIIVIFLGLIISTLISKNYAAGFGIIKGWFVFPLAFSLIVCHYVPREKRIFIFQALYFSAFSVALISIVYLISGRLTFDGRLQAIFNSPNYLAMYLAPGIIIGIIMLVRNLYAWSMAKIYFYCLSLAVIIISFYYTYSYAAWISLIVSLAAIIIFQNKIISRKIYWLTGTIIILALILASQTYSEKLNNLIFSNRSSLASRIMIWRAAGKILTDNWLWGIGPGNFQTKYLAYQKYFPPYLQWAVPHPHNLYLAFWLYGGILGILGFLGLIYFWLRNLSVNFSATSIQLISLGIILYFLLHGLVDTTYFKNDLAIIFWLAFWQNK